MCIVIGKMEIGRVLGTSKKPKGLGREFEHLPQLSDSIEHPEGRCSGTGEYGCGNIRKVSAQSQSFRIRITPVYLQKVS
jgi:hypothetical protein